MQRKYSYFYIYLFRCIYDILNLMINTAKMNIYYLFFHFIPVILVNTDQYSDNQNIYHLFSTETATKTQTSCTPNTTSPNFYVQQGNNATMLLETQQRTFV